MKSYQEGYFHFVPTCRKMFVNVDPNGGGILSAYIQNVLTSSEEGEGIQSI
jgi:hypothetical protein